MTTQSRMYGRNHNCVSCSLCVQYCHVKSEVAPDFVPCAKTTFRADKLFFLLLLPSQSYLCQDRVCLAPALTFLFLFFKNIFSRFQGKPVRGEKTTIAVPPQSLLSNNNRGFFCLSFLLFHMQGIILSRTLTSKKVLLFFFKCP